MKCKGFNDFEGCGKCKINLSDNNNIKDLSILSMSEIVTHIITFLINNGNKKLELETSIILCDGSIELTYSGNENKNYTHINRYILKSFISQWYKYYKIIMYDALALIHMSKVVSILNLPMPDDELIKRAIELDTAMEILINPK